MMPRATTFSLCLLLSLLAFPITSSWAQLRGGASTGLTLSTEDGLGLGVRGRLSYPINQDLSVGTDLGLTGYIFNGTDNATYHLEPQLSAIINLPQQGDRVPYILAGFGAQIILDEGNGSNSGPTIHGGYGIVWLLRASSLFAELNPALIIGKESVDLLIPVRIGLIF